MFFVTEILVFGMAAFAYIVVILPMQNEIRDIKEKQARAQYLDAVSKKQPTLGMNLAPSQNLPDIDDIPESVWEFGDYGEDSTPDQVEEEMTDLERANKEAEQSWQDLEALKHGKPAPVIYSG